MAKTYQANNFTGQQLDDFMGRLLSKSFAGKGLTIDDEGVIHNQAPGYGNLVYSYTYTANKEIHAEGVNLATGVFTATGHGLSAGDVVYVVMNVPYNVGKPYDYLPGGLILGAKGGDATPYYVNVIDENSFSLSTSSGGDTVTFTEVSTMDLAKFHFEKMAKLNTYNGIYIENLPQTKEFLVRILGRVSQSYRYVLPKPYYSVSEKMGYAGYDYQYGTDGYGSVGLGRGGGHNSLYAEIVCRIIEPGHILMVTNEDILSYDASNTAQAHHNRKYNHYYTNYDYLNGFEIENRGQFFNGTTVEVYTK